MADCTKNKKEKKKTIEQREEERGNTTEMDWSVRRDP
jgi:hypothetical protein